MGKEAVTAVRARGGGALTRISNEKQLLESVRLSNRLKTKGDRRGDFTNTLIEFCLI